jgi:hypothetical protein
MAAIEHSSRMYYAERDGELFFVVARYPHTTYSASRLSARDAWMWLGNHGLPRRKIRKVTGLTSVPPAQITQHEPTPTVLDSDAALADLR